MAKWKKSNAQSWSSNIIDCDIWCPCDDADPQTDTVYCQEGRETTCPKCGKVYRIISSVYLQEKVVDK